MNDIYYFFKKGELLLRGNEIDISIIVRNAILEELYEEKEIDEKTYHKMKEIFLNQEKNSLDK